MSNRELYRQRRREVEQLRFQIRKPNTPILNPKTGTPSFGTFPGFREKYREFPAGPIYLNYGRHQGAHRGFGLAHIMAERAPKCGEGDDPEQMMLKRILEVLTPGAPIFYETGERAAVACRLPAGTVILELRSDGQNNPYYSIVTYFPNAVAHGVRVAVLPAEPPVQPPVLTMTVTETVVVKEVEIVVQPDKQ